MNIPSHVVLAGIPIDIVLVQDFMKNNKAIGQSFYLRQQIVIDPDAGGPDIVKQALLHEVVHWILFIMNEYELRNNEKFVDTFAHLLYQALDSMERSIQMEEDLCTHAHQEP